MDCICWTNDILMLSFCEVVVCYLADAFDYPLCEVLLRYVAIVVYENFKLHGCVATYLVEDCKNSMFVLVAAVARVKQF